MQIPARLEGRPKPKTPTPESPGGVKTPKYLSRPEGPGHTPLYVLKDDRRYNCQTQYPVTEPHSSNQYGSLVSAKRHGRKSQYW